MPNTSENGNPWTFFWGLNAVTLKTPQILAFQLYILSTPASFFSFFTSPYSPTWPSGWLSEWLSGPHCTEIEGSVSPCLWLWSKLPTRSYPSPSHPPELPQVWQAAQPSFVHPYKVRQFSVLPGNLQNKGEWVRITFIIRLSRDSGNRIKTIIAINLTIAGWAFLYSVLTTDHYFEVKNCLQGNRWIRWIHVQLIFIICGSLKYNKAMLCLTEKLCVLNSFIQA